MQCTWFLLSAGLTAGMLLSVIPSMAADPAPSSVLDFTVKDINGKDVPLSEYKGKVLIIVNTASLCGNTPQYAKLETLYEKYRHHGLRILAFPANNFGHQEPGTDSDIKQFCSAKYSVKFDLFSKISVKGDDQAPLYKFLTDPTTDPKFAGDIDWNFAKFLIGRNGQIVDRYKAGHDPLSPDVIADVEAQLAIK
jgi:glutathione peroxidase